jgi:hypothetical protein
VSLACARFIANIFAARRQTCGAGRHTPQTPTPVGIKLLELCLGPGTELFKIFLTKTLKGSHCVSQELVRRQLAVQSLGVIPTRACMHAYMCGNVKGTYPFASASACLKVAWRNITRVNGAEAAQAQNKSGLERARAPYLSLA